MKVISCYTGIKGGIFTRYDPNDPECEEKKSLLDLIIISKNLEQYFHSIEVDSNLKMTPFRAKSGGKLVYTDHYAILVKFKEIPLKRNIV